MKNQTRYSSAHDAFSPINFIVRVGRYVVDFGFASLLEKFEEHYGKTAGKILVGFVGAAVLSVCVGFIGSFFKGIYEVYIGAFQNKSFYEFTFKSLEFVLAGFIITSFLHMVATTRIGQINKKKIDDYADKIDSISDEIINACQNADIEYIESLKNSIVAERDKIRNYKEENKKLTE